MCLVLSGMVKKHNFAQKSLGNLKGGTPSFCKYDSDSTCAAKELRYAACAGVAICQKECWSETSSTEACNACQRPWCKNKMWKSYFVICGSRFASCKAQYSPDDYNKESTTDQMRVEGRLNCWGSAPKTKKVTYLDRPVSLATAEQCNRALNPNQYPFVEYMLYFNFCKEKVCNHDIDNPESDPPMCERVWCEYHGITSNGASREYLNCNVCMYCRIQNMALTGNYDRKLFGGKQNAIIHDLGIDEATDDQLWRPAKYQMTEQIASLLPAKGCQMCDLKYERITCRDMCNKLQQYIVDGTDVDDPYFRWAHSVCKANRCTIHLRTGCKECTSRAEKNARKEWKNALGESEISNNFQGWGCQRDCKAYKMSVMAEYPGSDISKGWSTHLMTAFGIMDAAELTDDIEMGTEEWNSLFEWANSPDI